MHERLQRLNLRQRIRKNVSPAIYWKMRPIRAYFAGSGGPKENFGDLLTPDLTARIFGSPSIFCGSDSCDLFGVGSLLEIAEASRNRMYPAVWGSGFIADGRPYAGPPMNFLAVRGRLTAERVTAGSSTRDIVVGDPGLLVKLARPELGRFLKKYEVGIVPHLTDRTYLTEKNLTQEGAVIIDVESGLEDVLVTISQCKRIVSSSLHGLIIADALEIPNEWVTMYGNLTGGDYKFHDYYSAFGIDRHPTLLDPTVPVHHLKRLTEGWEPPPNLQAIQRRLVSRFPLSERAG